MRYALRGMYEEARVRGAWSPRNEPQTDGRDGAERGQAQGLQSDHPAHQQSLLPRRQGLAPRQLLSPAAKSHARNLPTLPVSHSDLARREIRVRVFLFFFLPAKGGKNELNAPLDKKSHATIRGGTRYFFLFEGERETIDEREFRARRRN